jgi:transcriptional pleiotropic regulator of transition state genes
MKATGIVRQVDHLGRFVIPKEIRKSLQIDDNDSLEIFTEGDRIILKKYAPACIFCNELEGVTTFKGKLVCPQCIAALASISDSLLQ